MKDSFSIYRSTFDALVSLPPDIAQSVLKSVGEYSMDDKEPDQSDPIAYAFFCQIRPLLDKSKKRAEAGRAGGEASDKQTEANVSKRKQTEANVSKRKQTEANSKQTEANSKQTEANGSKQQANSSINKKEEIRKEKIKDLNTLSSSSADYEYEAVIDYLNAKAGTAFRDKSRDTRSHIKARFDDGFTLEDFKTVIDKKVAEWGGTDMAKYLRPATLFGTKFEAYLNQTSGRPKNSFNNFSQRDYDYAELERQLIAAQRATG